MLFSNFLILTNVIFLASVVAIFYAKSNRKGIKPVHVFYMLSFLSLLAMNRIISIIMPASRLYVFASGLCSIYSTIITANMIPFLKHLLKLPSREELHIALDFANQKHKELLVANMELNDLNRRLQIANESLRQLIDTRMWIHDRNEMVCKLQAILDEMNLPPEDGSNA